LLVIEYLHSHICPESTIRYQVTLGCSKWGNCPWSSVTAEGSTARVKVLTAVLLKIEVFQGCDTVTMGEQFMAS